MDKHIIIADVPIKVDLNLAICCEFRRFEHSRVLHIMSTVHSLYPDDERVGSAAGFLANGYPPNSYTSLFQIHSGRSRIFRSQDWEFLFLPRTFSRCWKRRTMASPPRALAAM